MILDPRCHDRPDILAKPLNFERLSTDTPDMQHSNTPRQEGFAALVAFTLLLFTFAALASCGSSGGAGGSSSSVPRYYTDEPDDTWQLATLVNPAAPVYEVEGNIHHGDLDHAACALPTVGGHLVDVSVDYAAGWDMEVQIGWINATGAVTSLWGGYDAWGDGNMSATVMVPEGAGWLALMIRQSQNPLPDSTRYTFTVEVL